MNTLYFGNNLEVLRDKNMKKFLILLMIVVFLVTFFAGCKSSTPIAQACLDYFKSLESQKFWSQQSVDVKIEDASNEYISPFTNESKKEWYVKFYSLDIVSKDKTGAPVKATITANILDTKANKELTYQIIVNENNEEALKTILDKSESDDQRNSRLYSSTLSEAKKLISGGKLDLAIQKIGEARRVKDTDEVKSLLDSVYYTQGESLYKNKDYDQAKNKLRNVLYDANWKNKAQILLSKIDAEEKAAAAAKLEKARKALWPKEDKFKNVTFIMHDLDPDNLAKGKIYLFPYIGTTGIYPSSDYGSNKWYFLRLQMYFDDWIFAEKVDALVGDVKYETPVYDMFDDNVTQEVWNYGVFEKIDFKDSDSQVDELVRAVVNAPIGTNIKFRIEGKDHYREFTMTREEHQAWKDVMYFYDNGL